MFLEVKRVRLVMVSPDEKSYAVNLPGVLEIEIRRQLDDKGVPQLATAALDYFSNQIDYARNLIYKVFNPGEALRWDYTGRQANFRHIDLDARDYRGQSMLIQFGDGPGYFTKKQLELIKTVKLPTLPTYPKPGSHASK